MQGEFRRATAKLRGGDASSIPLADMSIGRVGGIGCVFAATTFAHVRCKATGVWAVVETVGTATGVVKR